jgi:hypothetical protein
VSDPFASGASWVKGVKLKFPEFECDLLKKADIVLLIDPSFEEDPGLFGVGVFGDRGSAIGVGVVSSFLPADGGGVAAVFSIKGGCV